MSASKTDAGAGGAGLIVLAATCFGTLGPLSRFAENGGVGAIALVGWRSAIGALCVMAFLAVLRRPIFSLRGLPRKDRWMLAAAAAVSTLLNFAVFAAFVRISIALALLLFYLYPAFVALASMLWFGERLDRLRWTALGVSLAGMVMVVGGGASLGGVDLLGVALAFFAGVAQAFYVLAARHGFGAVPGPQAAALTMGGGTGFLLVIGLVSGQLAAFGQPLAGFDAMWPVLLAGTVGAGVPTMAFIIGIRRLGPSRGAILATLEPVVGVALAALLLGERPGPTQLIGGALIIVAGVLLQLRPRSEVADHEALAQADQYLGTGSVDD